MFSEDSFYTRTDTDRSENMYQTFREVFTRCGSQIESVKDGNSKDEVGM